MEFLSGVCIHDVATLLYSLDLTITLDSPQLEGAEGSTVLVCASISGNITLDISSVSASLTIFRVEQSGIVRKSKYTLLKMGCLKTPLQGCSSTGPGVWVFNNNPRVSKGCEVLKVGCLKTLTEVFQGCGCLILKLCGGHYLE